MSGFRLLSSCAPRFIWGNRYILGAEVLVDDWVEVGFLGQQVQIVHQVSEIGSVASWLVGFRLWRGADVGRYGCFCLCAARALLVRRFGLVQSDWLVLFVYWERAADYRLPCVAGGAFGFLCFILRRVDDVASLLCSTIGATGDCWGHHVLLIGVVLQLLLYIRNVERRWIYHTLRYVLVGLNVASI
jgi:hypothetical protein